MMLFRIGKTWAESLVEILGCLHKIEGGNDMIAKAGDVYCVYNKYRKNKEIFLRKRIGAKKKSYLQERSVAFPSAV